MRVGLQLLRGGFGVLGGLAAAKSLDLVADGASHETMAYVLFGGATLLFAALFALTTFALSRREGAAGATAGAGQTIQNSSAGRDIVQTSVTHHHHAPRPPKRKKVDPGVIGAGEPETFFSGTKLKRLRGAEVGLRLLGIPFWNEAEDPGATISGLKAFIEVQVISQSEEARKVSEDWEKGPNIPIQRKRRSRPPRIRSGDCLDQGSGRWRELPPQELGPESFPNGQARAIDLESDRQRHVLDVLALDISRGHAGLGWRLAADPAELTVFSHPLRAGKYRLSIVLRSPDMKGSARFVYELEVQPADGAKGAKALPTLTLQDSSSAQQK
jgi:hypothetical protein